MFDDLRGFLEALDERGLLRKIEGADWDLEIGVISELEAESQKHALLFDKIKGHPDGYRVANNLYLTPTAQKIGSGIPEELSNVEAVRYWKDKWNEFEPLPPVEVESGPVLQNILTDNQVDVLKFPTPKWQELDGGRYIGTGDQIIMRDPDDGWINIGTYRVMVQDSETVTLYISPGKHCDLIRRKYWERGESCPVVMCFGGDLALFAVSSMLLRWGFSEFDAAGYWKGKPMEYVKGRLTGLPIPATSEIVMEGFHPPPSVDARQEGPFGEWTGYYASGSRTCPVVQVKTIYHRDDPIIHGHVQRWPLGSAPGAGPIRVMIGAPLWHGLERAGMPGIKGVYIHGQYGIMIAAISLEQQYPGHAKQVLTQAAAILSGGNLRGRYIITVDDDIDVGNWDEVVWAICTRCDPETSIDIVRGFLTSALEPQLSPEKREKRDFTSAKVLINACRPYHWRDKFPPVNKASDQLRKKVLDKWGHLFV